MESLELYPVEQYYLYRYAKQEDSSSTRECQPVKDCFPPELPNDANILLPPLLYMLLKLLPSMHGVRGYASLSFQWNVSSNAIALTHHDNPYNATNAAEMPFPLRDSSGSVHTAKPQNVYIHNFSPSSIPPLPLRKEPLLCVYRL